MGDIALSFIALAIFGGLFACLVFFVDWMDKQ